MYVGITHETAPVVERAYYAFSDEQKQDLTQRLKQELQIKALTILTTCNRTEIYFESSETTPYEVRDTLLDFVRNLHNVELNRKSFHILDRSIDTVNHLLHVANGLRSAVIGDKQIITQIKEAYQQALQQKNQGSLLERAFQSVFRSHKRVYAESLYKQGSTSTAYSSLKMVEEFFGKEEVKNLSILIIGAGEIAEDVLKYLSKFHFWNAFIANRTSEKASRLAERYGINTYDWEYVENGDFTFLGVVITAVGNRKNLVDQVEHCGKKRLWIDLAMPSNVNPSIADNYNTVYTIDEVTEQMNAINEAQLTAIPTVEGILMEELNIFTDWLKKSKIRSFLRSYKNHAKQMFLKTAPEAISGSLGRTELESFADKFANKLVRKSVKTLNRLASGELPQHQLEIMHHAFGK